MTKKLLSVLRLEWIFFKFEIGFQSLARLLQLYSDKLDEEMSALWPNKEN